MTEDRVPRCDRIVNNGYGEPTECGRSLPCEYHDRAMTEDRVPTTCPMCGSPVTVVPQKYGPARLLAHAEQPAPAMTEDRVPADANAPVDFEEQRRMERWMRRQRMLSPFRRVWHRLRGHSVGRYACFTCDMDLPR